MVISLPIGTYDDNPAAAESIHNYKRFARILCRLASERARVAILSSIDLNTVFCVDPDGNYDPATRAAPR